MENLRDSIEKYSTNHMLIFNNLYRWNWVYPWIEAYGANLPFGNFKLFALVFEIRRKTFYKCSLTIHIFSHFFNYYIFDFLRFITNTRKVGYGTVDLSVQKGRSKALPMSMHFSIFDSIVSEAASVSLGISIIISFFSSCCIIIENY